jgi:hypothetical protein
MDSHSIPVRLSSDQIAWLRRYVEVAYANSAPPTRSDLLRRWIAFGTIPDLANLTPAQQNAIGPYPIFVRKDGVDVEAQEEKHRSRTEGNRKRAAAAGRRSPPAIPASPRRTKATSSKPQKKGRVPAG